MFLAATAERFRLRRFGFRQARFRLLDGHHGLQRPGLEVAVAARQRSHLHLHVLHLARAFDGAAVKRFAGAADLFLIPGRLVFELLQPLAQRLQRVARRLTAGLGGPRFGVIGQGRGDILQSPPRPAEFQFDLVAVDTVAGRDSPAQDPDADRNAEYSGAPDSCQAAGRGYSQPV